MKPQKPKVVPLPRRRQTFTGNPAHFQRPSCVRPWKAAVGLLLSFVLPAVVVHGSPALGGVKSAEGAVVPKLREFCQSCHAVGDIRFIRSALDHDVWAELFKGKSPGSGKVWAEAIIDVLDWPSDDPPDFDSPIAPGHDWMPKGSKRLALAMDTVDGESTRRMLLRELRKGLVPSRAEGLYPRCAPSPRLADPGLGVRKGYIDFINPAELASVKEILPVLADAGLDRAMRDPETMWYDEETMAFAYQDSEETITGVRANCVGREVGERNADIPGIFKLTKYFGSDYRFREPFRKAAGTNESGNVKVVNFWLPPRDGNGDAIPVRYWQLAPRGRWRWAFPVDTLFGEVLMQRDPEGKLHVFEVRTRRRYLQGWAVNMFRPFRSSQEMAVAVRALRPNWLLNPDLVHLVQHLEDPGTLREHSIKAAPFAAIFPEIKGAIDEIPAISDDGLVKALLHRKFVSVEGAVWKESPGLLTYAPGSAGEFSIVPRGYEMGLIPVNDESCARCHTETGRRLGQVERDIVLYGEVWGEDQIFTWHLFEPNRYIFDVYDEKDGSRVVNPRMVRAGLVVEGKPDPGSKVWRALPSAYDKPPP